MVKIHPTAIVDECVEFGENVEVEPYCIIGLEGQIRGDRDKRGKVIIGDNSFIRSGAVIHRGSEGRATVIGPDGYIMAMSHIGHDVVAGRHLTLTTGACLGGHCILGDYVTVGLNAMTHQRLYIGDYVMIGMGSTVTKNLFPTLKVAGNPARILGFNDRYKDKLGYQEDKERFLMGDIEEGWLNTWRVSDE